MRIDRATERFKGGRAPGVSADARKQILQDLRVTDGGVYDNMGLEPVWKGHRVVLVSDADGLMDAEADKSWTWRIKRFLISGFTQGTIKGAYIGVGSSTARYAAAREPGYSKAFALDVIANSRTDLDGLQRCGAGGADESRVRAHRRRDSNARPGVDRADAVFAVPLPAFAPPGYDGDELRRRLAVRRRGRSREGAQLEGQANSSRQLVIVSFGPAGNPRQACGLGYARAALRPFG